VLQITALDVVMQETSPVLPQTSLQKSLELQKN